MTRLLWGKDRRINKCPIVADAASIRTDAGSVGHDSYFCASPKLFPAARLIADHFSTTQMLRNRTGLPWSCRWIGPGSCPSLTGAAVVDFGAATSL